MNGTTPIYNNTVCVRNRITLIIYQLGCTTVVAGLYRCSTGCDDFKVQKYNIIILYLQPNN